MQRPPIEKIRRLSLLGAILVAVLIGSNYGWRRWQSHRARQSVPAFLPQDVQQQAERFTFSRSEQGRTLFTVQAGRTTEREGKTTVLEEVKVEIYGRTGNRVDELETHRCEYDVGGTGRIYCPDEVKVRLGARESSGENRRLEIGARQVQFDTTAGTAWTEQPVGFVFSQGRGQAVGMRYQPQEPAVILEKDVFLEFPRGPDDPLRVTGAELRYYSRERRFELLPPLRLTVETHSLRAERVEMRLDADFRIQALEAVGTVEFRGRQNDRDLHLRAERVEAHYAPDGRMETVSASGAVWMESRAPDSRDTLTCRAARLVFDPSHRWVKQVEGRGEAVLVSETAAERREMRGTELTFELRAGGLRHRVLRAPRQGRLQITRRDGEERTLEARQIQMELEGEQLRELAASGEVRTSQRRPRQNARTTEAQELRARFDPQGRIHRAEQWGDFRYQDARWQAQAGRAEFEGAGERFRLLEKPALWDASHRTTAQVIELEERSGRFRAWGEVRTTEQPPPGESRGFGSSDPMHVAAERMVGERERGWARYEGEARLWQGENRLAARAIEFLRAPGELRAEGEVKALFLDEPTPADPSRSPARDGPGPNRGRVTITSERFHYQESQRRGVFTGAVRARNQFGVLTAPRLEVLLRGEGRGSERVERAQASGGVRIEQPQGWAVGEEAEYRAAEQTVVLWGGSPTLSDRDRSQTSGARLTFFLADGTILVESADGIPTVTRRPWTQ